METSRGEKTICIPFESEELYKACMDDAKLMRQTLETLHRKRQELFPKRFGEGFRLDDRRFSEKMQMWVRRVEVKATGEKFSIRPSFAMPYMTATTEEVEKGLYLRQWNVPYDALTYVFGRSPMFWYRAELALGRASIVGTTIKDLHRLPEHLVADEKHTNLTGEKVFVPIVVGGGCILGVSLSKSADAAALESAYGEFAEEAREVSPSYAPKSVCTDGWEATQSAFKSLFKGICIILCFLHSVLKISERCKRDFPLRRDVLTRAWDIYKAKSRSVFAQRVRRLREWTVSNLPEGAAVRQMLLKLCSKRDQFIKAFEHPRAHRTSNAVDRLINHLDRRLFIMRKLHGTRESARLLLRSIALQRNFQPYGPRLRSNQPQRRSAFHDLNGFEYHSNWLHNLLISSSMGGRRP